MKIFLSLLIIFTLSACSLIPAKPPGQVLAGSELILERQNDWSLRGKIGVKTPSDGGSAFIHWDQTGRDYQIKLHGPLGQGAVFIQSDGKTVTASSKKLGTRSASTADELFYHEFGWEVPVSNLHYWIRGLAAPKVAVIKAQRDSATHRLTQFEQDNWLITISRYQLVQGHLLPKKIKLEATDIRVTIALASWELPNLALNK